MPDRKLKTGGFMDRRTFVGGAIAAASVTKAFPAAQKVKAGDIPTTTFGKTGIKVSIIGQGGARMDLHPNVQSAATYLRNIYELGITYFDCSHIYWGGRSEEAYGLGLADVRKSIFLTTKTTKRTAKDAQGELETSFSRLKTDHVDLWQMHDIRTKEDIETALGPGGAIEAFEAAKKAGKCRFIGFTGHFDPNIHLEMLNSYAGWDTVLMPVHALDYAYLSFENSALPAAIERNLGIQAIKVFGKAFLLRSLSPTECLQYALSQPGVHVAICGAGTLGQMEDNIRAVQKFKKLNPDEIADIRKRASVGAGVYTGPTMEYWKRKT
jgi:predicted aldo/keto reductase-like oxidoreductase